MFGDYHADTHNFIEKVSSRAPKEIGCAFVASALVSPLVSIVDKCIVQDINGTAKFLKAVCHASKEMVMQPKNFFGGLSFRLTFLVYFGTYATVNLSELALDANRIRDDEERKTYKVGASSIANISLLAWRDSIFAREFSIASGSPAPAVTPLRTLALFAARDAATMYATFYAAPRLAEHLQDEYEVGTNVAELSCALAVPAVFQVLTAPLHIHAMCYYGNPCNVTVTWQDRWATIRREFATVSFARSVRILPAFGIGSFSNNKFREYAISQTDVETFFIKRQMTKIQDIRRYMATRLG